VSAMNKNLIPKREANRRVLIVLVLALTAGIVVGYFLGRWKLNREWLQTTSIVSEQQYQVASAASGEPTPAAGTTVLRPLPLRKSREALAVITANDPLVMTVGAVGRSGDDVDLHLTVENRGKCKITGFEGVVYGFDAWGRPSKLNKGGEHYVAFSAKEQSIEAGKKVQTEMALHHVDNASLAVAHFDKVVCEDGTKWSRN